MNGINDTDLIHSPEREKAEEGNDENCRNARNGTYYDHHHYIRIHDVHNELIKKELA